MPRNFYIRKSCHEWLHSQSNLDRSRFVRQDRSSPVKKNTQIFLVVVGVVILFSPAQSATDHALF